MNLKLGCIQKWCPGVVELECSSVVCADSRRVYLEVVSECSVEWCPSVVCADSRRVYPKVASECIVVWCPSVGAQIFERGVCPSV